MITMKSSIQVFERLLAQDDILLANTLVGIQFPVFRIYRKPAAEVFRDEAGNNGGIAPSGHEVEWVSEESYFLRLSVN